MDSLVGYGSDDENESERYGNHHASVSGGAMGRRRDDDTNYDDVGMDLSEDSQAESEPELPPAEPAPKQRDERRDDSRPDSRERPRADSRDRSRADSRDRSRADSRDRSRVDRREQDRRLNRRESPPRSNRPEKRPDRRHDSHRPERKDDRGRGYDSGSSSSSSSRRGLLGDRPDDRTENKMPALMDLKPYGGEPPPGLDPRRSQDARDAVSPRFTDRGERRDRERDRDRDGRHSRRSEEKKSSRHSERRSRSRSRSRGAAFPPPHHSNTSGERRGSPPSGDYRPSSYKVNKKLEVMEKMGLQIKTPDGMMATAQQLRAAAGDAPHHSSLPGYYNPGAVNSNKILDQVQKRKLLWSNKNKSEAEEAAKWSGTRFAQDNDGRQVSKFMRLMGIKEPGAVKDNPDTTADPIKKQEELFQAMQAQYEVARATTHTMRGVGLGFQRGQF